MIMGIFKNQNVWVFGFCFECTIKRKSFLCITNISILSLYTMGKENHFKSSKNYCKLQVISLMYYKGQVNSSGESLYHQSLVVQRGVVTETKGILGKRHLKRRKFMDCFPSFWNQHSRMFPAAVPVYQDRSCFQEPIYGKLLPF